MTYENVRAEHGNICTDENHAYGYTFNHETQAVLQKSLSTGAIAKSWPADSLFSEVVCLEYDGYYWWTLEYSYSGIVLRKWEKRSNIFAALVSTFSFTSSDTLQFASSAFAAESYVSTITTAVGPAVSTIEVDDPSDFYIGDQVVLGPSTSTGYIGGIDKCSILNVAGTTVTVSPALSNRFSSGDRVVSPHALWVFNDYGDAATTGSLLKISAKTGAILLTDYGGEYKNVSAATYHSSYVLYYKPGQVVWLSPGSLSTFKVMAVDVLKTNRSSMSGVFELFGFGDFLYRLQTEVAYYSSGTWYLETWSNYNLVASPTIPEVYMVALSVEKPMQHLVEPPSVTTVSSTVNCVVYDQFMTPVLGKTVDFTTTAGTVTPLQAVTDANGKCSTVYLGDTQETLVTITAETT